MLRTSRPRNVGSFFVSRVCDSANEVAVASRRSMSSRARSWMVIRCRRSGSGGIRSPPTTRSSVIEILLTLGQKHDTVDLVDFQQLDLHALVARGGQVLADVVGADRQLAVAAVGEDGELYARRPAVLEQRVDRGADRATRVEDVVDEDDGAPLELEVEPRLAHDRLRPLRRARATHVDVVAVEGDVELAERELDAGALLDHRADALGERDAAGVDPYECDRVEVVVVLDDLVRDAAERAGDGFGVEQDLRRRPDGMVRHSTPFRPRWTGLKGRCGTTLAHLGGRSLPPAPVPAGRRASRAAGRRVRRTAPRSRRSRAARRWTGRPRGPPRAAPCRSSAAK